ncbi:hypothetical protein [Amphibacillus indicireducens]|uniref:Methionine ABC transporter permease n=1 Tax=Amphibacillus indicireducens TaxID=1076330 RepID=A0ABP7VTV0_9BACI
MIDTNITMSQFLEAIGDTFYMVGMSLLLGTIFGATIGIIIVVTRPGGIKPIPLIYQLLNPVINIVRIVYLRPIMKLIFKF